MTTNDSGWAIGNSGDVMRKFPVWTSGSTGDLVQPDHTWVTTPISHWPTNNVVDWVSYGSGTGTQDQQEAVRKMENAFVGQPPTTPGTQTPIEAARERAARILRDG